MEQLFLEQDRLIDKINEIITMQNDIINITNANAGVANHNIRLANIIQFVYYIICVVIILMIYLSHKELDQKLEKVLNKINTQKNKKIDNV